MRRDAQDGRCRRRAGPRTKVWALTTLLAAGTLVSGTRCFESWRCFPPSPLLPQESLPDCENGWLCVSIVNQTCVDVDVILYVHNGYDPEGVYATSAALECCEDENAASPCLCPQPGSGTGELQLVPPQLFHPLNRYVIGDEIVHTLSGRPDFVAPAEGGVEVALRCEDVKSIGLEVGLAGELPDGVQERSGSHYRCTTVATDRGIYDRPEQVPCGGTIQYVIYDRNSCGNPDVVVFRVDTWTSADCTAVTSDAAM